MNYAAIAHMPDHRYCFCLRPGLFLIRLQTGRGDLRNVVLHYQDKYIPRRFVDTRKNVEMKLVAREMAIKIQEEVKYPGQIKINLIRESRAVDYAK